MTINPRASSPELGNLPAAEPGSPCGLEVVDLRISIGGRLLVKGISFSVEKGQRVCLLGE
jgi:ATPase subunit of ABC transporter with duplicated ATPase domains